MMASCLCLCRSHPIRRLHFISDPIISTPHLSLKEPSSVVPKLLQCSKTLCVDTRRSKTTTGISYLDTWIGHNNSNAKRQVGPAAASRDVPLATLPASMAQRVASSAYMKNASWTPNEFHGLMKNGARSWNLDPSIGGPNNSISMFHPSTTHSPAPLSSSCAPLPSNSYQMLTLRPSPADNAEAFTERLQQQLQVSKQSSSSKQSHGATPLVLDFTLFHPDGSPHYRPPPPGTLTNFVTALRSNSACCLVGVTNLPSAGNTNKNGYGVGTRSPMEVEANALNLPIFQSGEHSFQSTVSVGRNFSSGIGERNGIHNPVSTNTMAPKRKRRGGVAPLLRPRRPLADSSTATSLDGDLASNSPFAPSSTPDTSSSSAKIVPNNGNKKAAATEPPSKTKDTFDDITNIISPNTTATNTSTKVHKGSIRSGQLLSSDHPHQSLVILGSVNPGGEVWSEGDVFVFGKLRGRVLAGLGGVGNSPSGDSEGDDTDAPGSKDSSDASEGKVKGCSSKIFATSFDPELVCIGDSFTTVDTVSDLGLDGVGPAMVTLDEATGKLKFEMIEV